MRRHDDADVFIPPTHAGSGGGGLPFQRICVPVGPGGQEDRTLAAAASLGAATGGRLRVVHVRMWDPAVHGGGGRFYLETSQEATAVLERALASVTPDVAATPWYSGFKLIPQKLQTVLESEGVTTIAALGQDFDPNYHEAVIYEAAEGQEGKVIGELQRGYKLRDRVLRPTMVKVGQG